MLSGAPRRIGFERGWARESGAALLYTERVTPVGRHVAELNYSLAEAAGAARPVKPEYPLRVPSGGAASVRASPSGELQNISSSAPEEVGARNAGPPNATAILPRI